MYPLNIPNYPSAVSLRRIAGPKVPSEKDTSSDEVLKAFQRVRENRPYLSHDLASEVAFMEARGTTNPLRRMTVRELQTLALVAKASPTASSPSICT